ncbi:MAG: SRPBCC family protein [Gammaproteobacteria bacterium]|nr:SRPBCC family protein [Gammaproteobacteria bacterium]
MRRTVLLIALTTALLPALSTAHGPSRQKVTREVAVNAPPDKVWAVIADFCAIETWHPAVVECAGEGGNEIGATRVLTIGEAGGPQLEEELQKYDTTKMQYKYKITKTDNAVLPVTTYSAFLTVMPGEDGGSTLQWRGGFYRAYPNNDPPPELSDEAAVNAVTGVYDAGLAEIKRLAEQ